MLVWIYFLLFRFNELHQLIITIIYRPRVTLETPLSVRRDKNVLISHDAPCTPKEH
jgi:hypothetical protein